MVYLFLGEDPLSKDTQLKKIRSEFLDKATEQFNLDILYARELTLKELQEKLLCLPVKSAKRIIVVKGAQGLKQDVKEYLLKYIRAPHKQIILILDAAFVERKDDFFPRIARSARTLRFKETIQPDSFTLSRSILSRKLDYSLRVLNQLLKKGERPEMILGGLRYAFTKNTAPGFEMKRRLKLLLDCDIEIKTGKLKALFALEKLVISLCGAGKPLR